ncbi:MAG: FAD-dependent oxidoreductase, partial [Coriobacteriia bacterium]|nr:FAD-dependent oxidoreductase [Coriobacteriia bacterium]
MQTFDVAIIGFGIAGKTIAQELAAAHKSVVIIEKDERVLTGSRTHAASIPTYILRELSKDTPYNEALAQKRKLIAELNQSQYKVLAQNENIELILGQASFIDEHTLHIDAQNPEDIQAQYIIIDSASKAQGRNVQGASESRHVLTVEELLELDELP